MPLLAFHNQGFLDDGHLPLVFINEYLFHFHSSLSVEHVVFLHKRIFPYVNRPCYFYGLSVVRPLVRLYLCL